MKKAPQAFRTISEVSQWLAIPTHTLRFWESKFNQIKPVKRTGGRRYYRPNDMQLLGGIKTLLYEDGLTIKGVKKILTEKGLEYVISLSPELKFSHNTVVPKPNSSKSKPKDIPAKNLTPVSKETDEMLEYIKKITRIKPPRSNDNEFAIIEDLYYRLSKIRNRMKRSLSDLS